MSWIEEQSYFGLEELYQDAIEEYETIKYRFLNYNLWTTKNNKIIPIKLLSNNHINNIIKKIEREEWRTYAYNKLKKELNDKEKQIQGVDVIFELNNKKFICDEKAAIRYVNKTLNTFSIELSFIDKIDKQHSGWLLDDNKINNSFLFIWIDKATKDILTSIDDIEILDYVLVYKKDIINYLNNLGYLTVNTYSNKI